MTPPVRFLDDDVRCDLLVTGIGQLCTLHEPNLDSEGPRRRAAMSELGIVERAALSLRQAPIPLPQQVPDVMNGPAVLAEVNEHAARWDGSEDHNRVLNFTLMPMNEQDQQLLLDVLGRADLELESGGFGNCRVMATTVRHVWAVQFVNAMGNTILDTLEIGRIPDAVLAAPEDFEDSSRRLDQILDAYL